MTNLVKSEFYKLKNSKAFYICIAISAVLAFVMAFSIQQGISLAKSHPGDPDMKTFLVMEKNLGGSWFIGQSLTQGIHILISAIFVSIFVAVEFNYGTMKNIVSKGFNRTHIYLSKFITSAIASLIMLFVYMIIAGITGTIMWGFDPNGVAGFGNILMLFLVQALISIAYTAVFVFVAMSLRSNGGSIALNICIVMLFNTVLSAINLLIGNNITLSNYWLTDNMSKLATLNPPSADITRGIIVAVVYMLVAIFAGNTLFKRRDIK